MNERNEGNPLQLTLATGAFAVCFAIFGSVSAMMPILKKTLDLSPVHASIALAIPVLLGSLGRIPLGMLTDRFGGRIVFSLVMVFSIIPAVLIGFVSSDSQLIAYGFFIGIALASFSVGVAFVSRWYPPERQGFALGVYGAGNIGQSLAAFGAPFIVAALGFAWGFWFFGALAFAWLLFFVAMAIYLPTFLTEMFDLTPQNAGLRTAGFVVLATALRPIGGVLADRVGGRAILGIVFPAVIVMAAFLAVPKMVPFTIGALGMAAAIGLGNGAVFRLVPEYFPKSVGAVTGLVGAAGGLGGFFPPLAFGMIRQWTADRSCPDSSSSRRSPSPAGSFSGGTGATASKKKSLHKARDQ
jgi:NNP family nitrate/nitrite transporter-like MFS transporter